MKGHHRWLISLISVLVVMGALGFGRFGYTMILPSMQEDLLLTNPQVGDLQAANMVGYLLLSAVGGFLASKYGARGVISLSLVAVAASLWMTGAAPGYRWALFGRFLTGIGSGGANVPIMGLLVAWYDRRRRGLAAGIAVSGSSFGLLVTGLTLPGIIARYPPDGWRAAWYLLAFLTAAIAVASLLLLRNRPSDAPVRETETPTGAGGETGAASDGRPGAMVSRRAPFARLLRSRQVWLLSVIYIAFGFSYVIYATFFARGLISVGFSQREAGNLWSGIGAASIASGFLWGVVSDRISRRYALAAIYSIQAASFLIFGVCLLTRRFHEGFYVSSGLFALTAFSIPAVMSAAAGDLIGPRLASAAFGIITLFFGVGQILGPFLAGRLAELTGGYGTAFILAAGVAAAGGILSGLLIPSRLQSHDG